MKAPRTSCAAALPSSSMISKAWKVFSPDFAVLLLFPAGCFFPGCSLSASVPGTAPAYFLLRDSPSGQLLQIISVRKEPAAFCIRVEMIAQMQALAIIQSVRTLPFFRGSAVPRRWSSR